MATEATLANRVEIKNAIYQLTGFSGSDGALSEHETNTGDALNRFVYQAMRDAQSWYLSSVNPNYWKKQSATLTFTDVQSTEGRYYSALPSDFLRLFGDEENSALRRPTGRRWGRLIDADRRNIRGSNYYWIENDQVSVARGATIPSDLVMDYTYLIPELTADGTAVDFPQDDRVLIPAFAAVDISSWPMFPGDNELRQRLKDYLTDTQRQIYVRGRRTKEPRKVKHNPTFGQRWFINR
jgi:hypothetical protein